MRPKIFNVGDEVTPVNQGKWINQNGERFIGPKYGEIYKVTEHVNPKDFMCNERSGYWFVKLEGFAKYAVREDTLAPVTPQSVIDELMEETIFEHA